MTDVEGGRGGLDGNGAQGGEAWTYYFPPRHRLLVLFVADRQFRRKIFENREISQLEKGDPSDPPMTHQAVPHGTPDKCTEMVDSRSRRHTASVSWSLPDLVHSPHAQLQTWFKARIQVLS